MLVVVVHVAVESRVSLHSCTYLERRVFAFVVMQLPRANTACADWCFDFDFLLTFYSLVMWVLFTAHLIEQPGPTYGHGDSSSLKSHGARTVMDEAMVDTRVQVC